MSSVLVCGAINWDTTCLVDHLPIPGEEVTCAGVSEVPGGTGANAAVAAARLLGRDEVALFAALGRDDIAQVQLGILETEGVVHEAVVRIAGQASGHAYIFVDHSGQNVIASSLGANSALTSRHARQARLSTLLQDCRCVALTDPPLQVAGYLLEAAADLGIPALWDPGVLAGAGWDALAPLTRKVDSLVLNEAEAAQLFGAREPERILRALDLRGAPSTIVLKQGARGSVLLECASGATTEIPPLPLEALGMEVVSSVGCGDVFLGTYTANLSLGRGREDALLMASAAAGWNATRPETRGGPTQHELEDLIDRAKTLGFMSARGKESLT
jgi:ribokinase